MYTLGPQTQFLPISFQWIMPILRNVITEAFQIYSIVPNDHVYVPIQTTQNIERSRQ